MYSPGTYLRYTDAAVTMAKAMDMKEEVKLNFRAALTWPSAAINDIGRKDIA